MNQNFEADVQLSEDQEWLDSLPTLEGSPSYHLMGNEAFVGNSDGEIIAPAGQSDSTHNGHLGAVAHGLTDGL